MTSSSSSPKTTQEQTRISLITYISLKKYYNRAYLAPWGGGISTYFPKRGAPRYTVVLIVSSSQMNLPTIAALHSEQQVLSLYVGLPLSLSLYGRNVNSC